MNRSLKFLALPGTTNPAERLPFAYEILLLDVRPSIFSRIKEK